MEFFKEFYNILRIAGYDIDPLTNLQKKPHEFTDEDGTVVYLRDSVLHERDKFPEFTDLEYASHVLARDEEQYNLYKSVSDSEDLVDLGLGAASQTLGNDDRFTYDQGDADDIGGDISFDSESEDSVDYYNLDDVDEWLIDYSDDNDSDDTLSLSEDEKAKDDETGSESELYAQDEEG